MATDTSDTFAALLRHFRRVGGLSQEQLAERASLTAQAIGALERGDRRRPYPETVRRLADALGLTAIHVNRVLRQLRELDLLTLHKGTATIHDLNGLRKLSGFQGGYLNSRD